MLGGVIVGDCFSCKEKQILVRVRFLFVNMEIVTNFEAVKFKERTVNL